MSTETTPKKKTKKSLKKKPLKRKKKKKTVPNESSSDSSDDNTSNSNDSYDYALPINTKLKLNCITTNNVNDIQSNIKTNSDCEVMYEYKHLPISPNKVKQNKRSRRVTAMEANILPIDDRMKANSTLALLDTGCTSSIIHQSQIPKKYWKRLKSPVRFITAGGSVQLRYKTTCEISLPELSNSKTLSWSFFVDEQENDNQKYKMFIGSDIMDLHGIDIIYSRKTIQWDDCYALMRNKTNNQLTDKNSDNEPEGLFLANDQNDPSSSKHVRDTATRVNTILDAKYEKADLPSIVEKIKSIDNNEKQRLLKLLKKFEPTFDGTLGNFDCEPAELYFKKGQIYRITQNGHSPYPKYIEKH